MTHASSSECGGSSKQTSYYFLHPHFFSDNQQVFEGLFTSFKYLFIVGEETHRTVHLSEKKLKKMPFVFPFDAIFETKQKLDFPRLLHIARTWLLAG